MEVYVFCITFGFLINLIFFGAGVLIGRFSQDSLYRSDCDGVCSSRTDDLRHCDVGDDLK